jgi:D-sedoheptulose 7-phosphate isomerase
MMHRMSLSDHLHQQFLDSIATQESALEALVEPIALAVERMLRCLMHDGKILVCGNGASASHAQLFAATLVNRFEAERPGLAAIALCADTAVLSAIAADHDYARVYSRQVEALGAPGDLLLAISASGNARGVLEAVATAQDKDMGVIALTGGDGGELAVMLREEDILLCAPAENAARIRETHLLTLHCLCEGIDYSLLGA